jgi:putative hydroxymethylpyrimidine transport system permease protein
MGLLKNVASGILAVVAIWQAAVWLLAPPVFMLPPPLDVAAVFLERPDYLLRHAGVTLVEIALGLTFGVGLGVATGLLLMRLPRLGRAIWPLMLVFQTLPVFAIAPLLVVWFGFGLASKVVMATLIIFFPVASAFTDGLRRTGSDLIDAAALAGAAPPQMLWRIRAPLALPGLVTGLRVAAALAPLGAVVGEWVGASAGLGFVMLQANARMQTDVMFAALAVLAVMTLILRYSIDSLAARLTPWAPEG